MRRACFLAALVLAASCGAGPASPTAVVGQPGLVLATGPYRLTLSMATGGASGFTFCVGVGTGIVGISVPATAQLERVGNTITIRPDDPTATFQMDLQASGPNLSGTASGQYRSSGITVTVNGGSQGPAAVATAVVLPSSVSGNLNGAITVGSTSCTGNGHSWSLTPID